MLINIDRLAESRTYVIPSKPRIVPMPDDDERCEDESDDSDKHNTNFNSPTCTSLTISSVIMENEGRCAPHKCHLDADEIRSSRYHRLRKVDGDESDESDEWGLDESEEDEREGPGDSRD